MKLTNNFISIIALGNFNPSILTPEFLKKNCGFESGLSPQGQTTPVVSAIDFGATSFLMELEKFQIMEKNPRAIDFTKIISVMASYLDVLSFTPVHVMGLNINVDIVADDKSVYDKLNDPKFILEVSQTNSIIYLNKMRLAKDENLPLRWEFEKEGEHVVKVNVDAKIDSFRLNYNAEKRSITEDRMQIKYLESHLKEIVSDFNSLLIKIWE